MYRPCPDARENYKIYTSKGYKIMLNFILKVSFSQNVFLQGSDITDIFRVNNEIEHYMKKLY